MPLVNNQKVKKECFWPDVKGGVFLNNEKGEKVNVLASLFSIPAGPTQ